MANFLPAMRGFAESATKEKQAQRAAESERQGLAYQSMLRGKEKQIPQALPPSQVALQQAQARAIPQQLKIAQEQEKRLKEKAVSDALNQNYTQLADVSNKETGGPLPGREPEYYLLKSKIMQYTTPFKPGGQLSDTEGKDPAESAFLKATRKFATDSSPKNWLGVMQSVALMPKGQPERGKEDYLTEKLPPERISTGLFGIGGGPAITRQTINAKIEANPGKETSDFLSPQELTFLVMDNIKSQQDLDDLRKNVKDYEDKGVNVRAILGHFAK